MALRKAKKEKESKQGRETYKRNHPEELLPNMNHSISAEFLGKYSLQNTR